MKIILIILAISQLLWAGESLQIKGSDTMVNLVQKLAESYMQPHKDKSISVSGGGSGTGIAALINSKTDIANSSREIKSKELSQCKKNKVNAQELTIAIDALSIIVNPKNNIKALSVEKLSAIYRGEITNWKQVGGADKAITLYGRQPNSGTYDFLREHVLKGEYAQNMIQMNGNSQIVEGVANDLSGIGYVGVAYIEQGGKVNEKIKILGISAKEGEKAYSPLVRETVYSGKYPIARGLNQYINGKPTGLTKEFISFELSKEGAKLIGEEGFYPVVGDFAAKNAAILK